MLRRRARLPLLLAARPLGGGAFLAGKAAGRGALAMIIIRILLVAADRIVLLVRVLLHDPLETTPFEPLLEALHTPREEAREAP